MRRSVDRLALILAATLAIGCTPGSPTTPDPVPVRREPATQPVPGKVPGLAIGKKKKEPGLGRAMPKASIQARSER